ncbi:MAG: hypothetical protein QM715_04165 [Nibricoccus sp.]
MKKILVTFLTGGVVVALIVGLLSSLSSSSSAKSQTLADTSAKIERGRYIVHGVGLCIDCHSPRTEKGELIEARQLTGAPLAFGPTVPMPWATVTPRIAGLPAGYSESQMIHFLMTGERPNNLPPPLPPMPPYRMNQQDAEAVTAYLHSLVVQAN